MSFGPTQAKRDHSKIRISDESRSPLQVRVVTDPPSQWVSAAFKEQEILLIGSNVCLKNSCSCCAWTLIAMEAHKLAPFCHPIVFGDQSATVSEFSGTANVVIRKLISGRSITTAKMKK